MRLTKIGKFLKEDFPGIAAWAVPLLDRVNDHIQSAQQVLEGNLTVNDNMAGSITELRVVTKATLADTWPVAIAMKKEPKVAVIGRAVDVTGKETQILSPVIAWKWEKGTFTILDAEGTDLAAGKTYRFQILALS